MLPNLASFGRHLRAANKSPLTIKSYTEAIRQLDAFLAARGMPRAVAVVRREHLETFIEDQLARLRPASAANRYRSLQQFFRWLVDEGEIRDTPMAKMKPPTVPDEPPTVLTDADLAGLWKVTAGTTFDERRDRAILRLLLDSGIRRAELAGLRLEDVDRDQDVVLVMGKGRRPRTVPYDRETARDLDRYIDRARKAHPHADEPWLWLGKKGRLTETGIAQLLRRRGREAGLAGLHPHLFRHTFAHRELARGMQETDLMRIAGWRSRQMVARYGASAGHERAIAAYRTLRDRDR
ncbi:MAG TPA: tyrosine-type recombinase/integrase [Candidatus Limnocylindria bacterium]|nr:tyrosine-type recombinase/integrase [Candidatus Limnocylindria bacterium]